MVSEELWISAVPLEGCRRRTAAFSILELIPYRATRSTFARASFTETTRGANVIPREVAFAM